MLSHKLRVQENQVQAKWTTAIYLLWYFIVGDVFIVVVKILEIRIMRDTHLLIIVSPTIVSRLFAKNSQLKAFNWSPS